PHQPLTYDVRLPDEAQADALRLLDASKAVVNQALTLLCPSLDEFGTERVGPAWKQVGKYTGSPQYHGDRQWRCESETVGRILRAQAERKKAFTLIAPILSEGLIRPKTDTRPAGKNRKSIKEAVTAVQTSLEQDDSSFVELQNVIEQACNYFLTEHPRGTSHTCPHCGKPANTYRSPTNRSEAVNWDAGCGASRAVSMETEIIA